MTKPDGVSPGWGTWEELLLAFAVNRHGTGAWDSIASELQKRTSDPNLCLTAHNCRSKYLDLKRRYLLKISDLEDGDERTNVEESVPLLEELRKLRVAELRREVQRYDLHIESLELKMKSMEEREKSEMDLESNKAGERSDCAPQPAMSAAELEKDRLSANESNSTDPDAVKLSTGEGREEVRNDIIGQTSEEVAALKSDSCNGSSNSIEERDRKEKKANKENSDVQSSASRSRKEEESDKVQRGSTSGHERQHEDQVKELPAQSQPLLDFLQVIRPPKLGSIFQRRLRSQETWKYEKLILQHMDLETVETRVKEGFYAGSAAKFFRDLLLLVNNALVFYPKNSAEATAAADIRRLISRLHATSYSSQPSPSLIVCTTVAAKSDDPKITKKRRRDRFPPSFNNNGKTKQGQPVKGGSSGDSQKSQPTSDSKKRGAVNFLNRMKQGINGVLKNAPLTKKEEARQTKEKEKRNVGRPPKRGGAPPPAAVGKRGKDRGEVEEAAPKQVKKKPRKL